MRKIRTALSFSIDDWRTLAQAWWWLLTMDVALRVLPFARVQAFAAVVKSTRADPDVVPVMRHAQRFINLASRYHLYPMTCLRQSLALQRMLGQRGIASDLRIGVRRADGKLDAHAWLECGGVVMGESAAHVNNFATML